jgi:hypothetical protein
MPPWVGMRPVGMEAPCKWTISGAEASTEANRACSRGLGAVLPNLVLGSLPLPRVALR